MQRHCLVWVADPRTAGSAEEALLDDVERARAGRFRTSADRARSVTGVSLLKRAVANLTGTPPESVIVDRACDECREQHGRPVIRGSDVHVSVSHSGGVVAVAVTRAGPVGIDVEERRGVHSAVAARILTSAEAITNPADVLTYWARKESAVKATGDGLRVPLREVVVTRADQPARLLSYQGRELAATMADLSLDPGCAAALTVLSAEPVTVSVHESVA